MRHIPLKPMGHVIRTSVLVATIAVGWLLGYFVTWWLTALVVAVYVSLALYFRINLERYLNDMDRINKSEIERIKAKGDGYKAILVPEVDIMNMDEIGGLILDDGTVIGKEDLKIV